MTQKTTVTDTKTNLERYRKDLNQLLEQCTEIQNSFYAQYQREAFKKALQEQGVSEVDKYLQTLPEFRTIYQNWYSEALLLIRQLLPERYVDFENHYKKPKTRKTLNVETYRIEDACEALIVTSGYGETKVSPADAGSHLKQQIAILNSVKRRFESSLFDIKQLVQADLFDSELEAALELLKKGFSRAGGAIAGVVLEKHLAQVANNHQLVVRKTQSTISNFNELLKNEGVTDVPTWRFIQRMGDIRNLCDHNKDRDPTKEEVEELIRGVEKKNNQNSLLNNKHYVQL